MRFFQLNKSYSYVLITLLCLIFLGASYFFIYLPKNETIIEAQRFRTLQNIDNNIHAKIDNSLSLVKTILRLYDKDSKNYLEKYIADYPRENFTLLLDTTSPNNKKDTSKSVSTIVVDDATKEITLLSDKQIITSLNNKTIQGSIKFSFKQFIEFLLPNAVFDEYVIFSKNNTVYESFPTGIGSVKEDSLLNTNNGIGGSYARDITVGGKDYKLFLQPVTFNNESKWILGGMLLKSRYQKERSELPVGIVMLLVTLLLAMIVIFPWIKLHQMGSKDRLTLLDGASSVLVSMLLMSILFFCFFKYNISIKNGDNPKDKKILTSSISNAFYSEIRKMYHILKTCDSLRVGHTGERDIINLNQSDIKFTSNTLNKTNKDEIPVDDSTKNKLSILMRNCIIDQIFWLDSSGSEKYNWISEKLNPPPGAFKIRKYFENINTNKAYYLDGDAVKKFYLDQVVSWNSGTFTSIVSIPSVYPSNCVGAISFTMRSLQDVVLPTGYTFAIIDNDGKVLYHSLSSRNLNENLKSEFTDSLDVSSCINARTEGDFNTQYYSKSYAVHIAPINNLPYFIAIFSDNSYKDAKDIETYSFTFSMLLLFFSFIALLLCTTLLVSSRRSFFKKQLFDTSWIGPRATCHKAYIQSAVINMLMIITLVVFFQKTTFLQYLFFLLFAVTFIFLFQNKLFAERYKKEKRINNHKFKTFAVWLLTAILFIIDVAAYNLLDGGHLLFLLTMELIAILFGWIFINYGDKFSHYYTKNIAKKLPQNIEDFLTAEKNYIKSFTLMALTSLIITSGIPVAFFYITSYNYEQNLGIRQRQTDYANRLLNLPSFKIDASSNKVIIKDSIGIYCDGSYISDFPLIVDYQNINKQYEAKENNITRKILENFHLAIGDKSINTNKLYIPYASDTSVIYQPLGISANADSTLFTYKKKVTQINILN